MKEICKVNAGIPLYPNDIRVVEWARGDPFPQMGTSVGVDTETELITDSVLFPPVVVLGCFDGANNVCYIVNWQDIPEFMHELCIREIEQRYFNLGFDEGVIDNEDYGKELLEAIDAGRVRDMQIRIHLNDIATKGWIPKDEYSLAGCAMKYLKMHLDKGNGTEDSARLSFRRDKPLTDEQYRYLPFDCISTWLLGEVVKEAPVDPNTNRSIEIVHTQGMVALAHIRANGFPVDMRIFDALEAKLKADYQDARRKVVLHGFPDPDYDSKEEARQIEQEYANAMRQLNDDDYEYHIPSRNSIRVMVALMWELDGIAEGDIIHDHLSQLLDVARNDVPSLRKGPAEIWSRVSEEMELDAFDQATKPVVMRAFIAKLMALLAQQKQSEGFVLFDVRGAIEQTSAYMDEHPNWLSSEKPVGPRKFFQDHVAKLLRDNKGLHLDKTPKSGEYKLTKKDLWRLDDAGVQDQFLRDFAQLMHTAKYLSTYMDRKYIASDGRVHPRFTSLVRTGRTSCRDPNFYRSNMWETSC